MNRDCLFCKIAGKEIPAARIYEDSHTLAFLDVAPRSPGHTVVISKIHSATLLDLPKEEVNYLFLAVQKVAHMVQKGLRADGLTIGINQGEVSGQTVPHLHVHVIPRFTGDGGGSIHAVVNIPSEESLQEIEKKIREVP